jgi:hypothetical protein
MQLIFSSLFAIQQPNTYTNVYQNIHYPQKNIKISIGFSQSESSNEENLSPRSTNLLISHKGYIRFVLELNAYPMSQVIYIYEVQLTSVTR